ncbi:MAG: ATP-binding protein [Agathobacter sp.]|nr:ATP-binding protein [Agathobacter sp.]
MHMKQVLPEIGDMGKVTAFFENELRRAGAPSAVIAEINVAVDEIFSNIARYSGAEFVRVGLQAEEHRVVMRFEDDGRPYDPVRAPEPDLALPAQKRRAGGLGIYMVKKMMDRMEYVYSGGLNQLVVEKGW